jgi:hypothetical protein
MEKLVIPYPETIQASNTDNSSLNARSVRRVPTVDRPDYYLRVGRSKLQVLDVSEHGVRVSLPAADALRIEQGTGACELRLGRDLFAGLYGRVAHITPEGAERWSAGIEWLEMGPRVAAAMRGVANQLQEELSDHE